MTNPTPPLRSGSLASGIPTIPSFSPPPKATPPATGVPPRATLPPAAALPPKAEAPVAPPASKPVAAPIPVSKPVAANAGVANPTSKKPVFSSKKAETPHGTKEFLFSLLDNVGAGNSSDLHVHPGKGMWRLTSGQLKKYEDPQTDIITEDEILRWMEHADGYEDMNVDSPEKLFGDKGHTTVAFDTGTWRVRGSFRKSTVGVSCTFRMIPSKIPTLEDVYLPEIMVEMIKRKSGLILIEGPTGSGKTTSIAALIDFINKNYNLHIYSVEDPIEFHHTPMGATVFTMREIGVHASDYASAVENALRSKPDVIFVGEMLSNATKKAALHAATTGHLVISTAHAGSVTEAIDSFIGEFSAEEQPQIRGRLSQSLLGVMCQSLIPTIEGKLVAAREVLMMNMNFKEIIKDGNMVMLHPQLSSAPGCFTLENSLQDLVERKIISIDEALVRAKNTEVLRQGLERAGLIAVS
jgi:twitching motility protein PilT